MKIEELENAPQWLLDAETHYADVDIVNGIVHWYGGVWEDGVWQDGIWENGVWQGGDWEGGYRNKLVPSDTPPHNN